MNSNNYTPYGYNPYNPSSNYRTNTYAFVNGIEGARAYQMYPNQTVLLMDSDSPLCFMKTSDNMGKATLRCFKLTEVNESELKGVISPTPDNNDIRNEISSINNKIEELYKLIKKEEN